MSKFIQNTLIVAGLIATAVLGYYLLVINNSKLDTGNQVVSAQAELETQEFLVRLNELKAIELSDELFRDPHFRSLVDYRLPVDPVAVGRSNPFEPTR